MPRDNRVIHRGIRLEGKKYLPDQEDELAAALTPEQGQILLGNGALSGNWKFTKVAEAKAEVPSAIVQPPSSVQSAPPPVAVGTPVGTAPVANGTLPPADNGTSPQGQQQTSGDGLTDAEFAAKLREALAGPGAEDVATAILQLGITSEKALRETPDDVLKSIPGLADGRLSKLRETFGPAPASVMA